MTAFKERPYRLLLWAALLVFALGLLDANTSPYIRLQSLYFPVSSALLYRLLSLGLASAWLLYRLTERFLFSRYLTWIHVTVTLGSLLALYWGWLYLNAAPLAGAPRRYLDHHSCGLCNGIRFMTGPLRACALLLIYSQLLYPIHLLTGIFSAARSHKSSLRQPG